MAMSFGNPREYQKMMNEWRDQDRWEHMRAMQQIPPQFIQEPPAPPKPAFLNPKLLLVKGIS